MVSRKYEGKHQQAVLHIQRSPVARTIFQLQVCFSICYRQRNAHTFILTFCSWRNRKQSKPACLRVGRGIAQYCQDCFCTGCTPQPWPALLSVLVPARGPCTPRSHSGTAWNRRTHSQIFALDMLKSKKLTNINKLTNRLTHKTRQKGRVNTTGKFANGNFTWFKCGAG